VSALARLGLAFGASVSLWLAAPDGVPILSVPGDPVDYIGMVAKQYGQGPGGAYDLSVVDPLWIMSIAAGTPPFVQPVPQSITTCSVQAPGGTFTTDFGSLRSVNLLPSVVVVVTTAQGVTYTTDIGSLRDAGLI